jgi:DNA-binding transcriptional regulator YiaG
MAKKAEKRNDFFEELKAGLNASIEHAEGKQKDLRTTTLPRAPKQLSAKEIVQVREELNVP